MGVDGFAALLLFSSIGYTSAACPQGTFVGLSGSCYKVFAEGHSFFYAEEECASRGGHLPSVNSAFENSFMRETLLEVAPGSTDRFWLGARRLSNADSWSWTDGKPFVYTRWAADQSSSFGCAYLSKAGTWSVSDCASVVSYLCEIPPVDEPEPMPKAHCDSEWTYFSVSNHCYKMLHVNLTFHDAESECAKESAHLASFHSLGENQAISDWAETGFSPTQWMQGTWIGFNTLRGGTYSWSDGSPIDFTNWRPSQPDTQTQCAIMNTDHGLTDELGTWDDVPCTLESRASVCRKPATNS